MTNMIDSRPIEVKLAENKEKTEKLVKIFYVRLCESMPEKKFSYKLLSGLGKIGLEYVINEVKGLSKSPIIIIRFFEMQKKGLSELRVEGVSITFELEDKSYTKTVAVLANKLKTEAEKVFMSNIRLYF